MRCRLGTSLGWSDTVASLGRASWCPQPRGRAPPRRASRGSAAAAQPNRTTQTDNAADAPPQHAGAAVGRVPGVRATTSVLVGTEVEVVECHGLTSGVAEVVVVVAVPSDGVRVRARLLGRLHPDVAVPLQAGA